MVIQRLELALPELAEKVRIIYRVEVSGPRISNHPVVPIRTNVQNVGCVGPIGAALQAPAEFRDPVGIAV